LKQGFAKRCITKDGLVENHSGDRILFQAIPKIAQ
jgi:hypothetical protein